MSTWLPTIGLEIHAELRTRTKMFCACHNESEGVQPNTNICPVCMAHPGALPVINKEAVKKVLLVGSAVGGKLADYSEFDRKNYFYPDIPKGYQISQYKFPLVEGGTLAGVPLTRIHLEEDTARSQHIEGKSLVDYNRAGLPLMELVTEPDIHSPEVAGRFARELQLLLRTLGVSEANMEKGEMRVEANISIGKEGVLGTKVEIKNLNSFRNMERAVEYEIKRQAEVLERGDEVVQETRGWDEVKQVTFTQRKKEKAHDYRYFPDPDLPSLSVSTIPEFSAEVLRRGLPELPSQKRERLSALGFLQEQDIKQLMSDGELSVLFNTVAEELAEPELIKTAANFILNDIAGKRKKEATWLPEKSLLVEVVRSYSAKRISSAQAKASITSGVIAEATDDALLPVLAQKIIKENPSVVADFKAGKQASLQFLVGQGMKESKGKVNPESLRAELLKHLG